MKLHLGCGKKYIPGFIHIDVVEYDHINHVASIDNLSFIPDESVDLIYNCHVLEHFKRQDVNRVLKEWYRVLKKGSILRTSVPDFEKIVEVYTKYKDLKMVIGPLFGRMDYLYNIHYNTFDFKTIEEELKKAGFKDVYRYNWQETIHKDYDDYSQAYIPHMDKENGILISLNVESIK
jgi:predicted SAM-dependent methyltransferase